MKVDKSKAPGKAVEDSASHAESALSGCALSSENLTSAAHRLVCRTPWRLRRGNLGTAAAEHGAHVLRRLSRVRVCSPVDCSPAGSSVHRVLRARALEGVAVPSPRDGTRGSCGSSAAGGFFPAEPLGSPAAGPGRTRLV